MNLKSPPPVVASDTHFSTGRLVWVTLVAALSGCTTVYEGKYDLEQGWRPATVVSVGPASAVNHPVLDACQRAISEQQGDDRKYATVTYRWTGRTLHRAVPLSAGTTVKAGDAVYLNVLVCPAPLVVRTTGIG
jgi:hypothetical protein